MDIQKEHPYRQRTLHCGGRLLDLSKPAVMGILNLSEDSFYTGSRIRDEKQLLTKAGQMLEEGAAILDIGAMSTRPGAKEIETQVEKEIIARAVKAILNEYPNAMLSVDTYRAEVAKSALDLGIPIINDISGFEFDPGMLDTLASYRPVYILMHNKEKPSIMMKHASYDQLLPDILDYFHRKIKRLRSIGLPDIIIDPGLGFSKTIRHNFEILKNLSLFRSMENPLLVGISRKSMIYKKLETDPGQALPATSALHLYALLKGADMLRVHDVREAVDMVKMWEALK